jgi:hypothetical protein
MDESVNTVIKQVSNNLLQNLDSKSINIELADKVLSPILKKLETLLTNTKSQEFPTNNVKEDFKNAQIELLSNQAYKTKYKRFVDEILPKKSGLKSLFSLPFLNPKDIKQNDNKDTTEDNREEDGAVNKEESFLSKITNFLLESKNLNIPKFKLQKTTNESDVITDPKIKNVKLENNESDVITDPKIKNVKLENNESDVITDPKIKNVKLENNNEGREKLIEEKNTFLLDGLTPAGATNLTEVLDPIFKDAISGLKPTQKTEDKKEETTSSGVLGELKNVANIAASAGSILAKAAPLLAKVAGPLVAIAGGEIIGGKIGQVLGEALYGEQGKEAYEKYGTGMTGLLRASYDYYQQSQDWKETEERGKKLETEAVERSMKSLEGSKASQDPEHYQNVENKLKDELAKAQEHEAKQQGNLRDVEEKSFFEREWGELDTARDNLNSAQLTVQTLQNRLAALEKVNPNKPDLKTDTTPQPPTPQSSDKSAIKVDPEPIIPLKTGGIVTESTIANIGEAGPEAVIPLEKYFDAENSALNNDTLKSIATNTENTNTTLKTLGDALYKLAVVLDKKMTTSGDTTVINTQNGQSQQIPSAASVARNNIDSIRNVRQQFRQMQFA